MLTILGYLLKEEGGQAMTEYGLILGLLVVGVIAVLAVMGPKLIARFQQVNSYL